jgi:large subunit ribosomal protein L24
MNKIKINDQVIILSGKDKKRTFKVKKILANHLILEGASLQKKHVKEKGILIKEGKIHISNVRLSSSYKEGRKDD